MRTGTIGTGAIILAVLIAGWLLGLVAQRAVVEATGYLDVSPPLLLLGVGLCALGGAAARFLAPGHLRPRTGAVGGVLTMVSIVMGYLALVFAYRDRFQGNESGETWFSLLLESWFWIGVPLLVGAGMGALGWVVADRLSTSGRGGTLSPQ